MCLIVCDRWDRPDKPSDFATFWRDDGVEVQTGREGLESDVFDVVVATVAVVVVVVVVATIFSVLAVNFVFGAIGTVVFTISVMGVLIAGVAEVVVISDSSDVAVLNGGVLDNTAVPTSELAPEGACIGGFSCCVDLFCVVSDNNDDEKEEEEEEDEEGAKEVKEEGYKGDENGDTNEE